MKELASIFLFILTALDFGNSVYQRYGKGGSFLVEFLCKLGESHAMMWVQKRESRTQHTWGGS